MPYFYFDPIYLLLSIPPLLLGLWAQMRVKGAFEQYSKVRTANGMSGAQAARRILDSNGLQTVTVERTGGTLSDHYDPRHKVLRLSGDVYQAPSLAAVGVAAHEAGHALQDQQHYGPLRLRTGLVPAVQFGSWLGPIIFIVGFFLAGAIGTTLAFCMSTVVVSLPEMVMLRQVMTARLLGIFVGYLLIMFTLVGWLFNIFGTFMI